MIKLREQLGAVWKGRLPLFVVGAVFVVSAAAKLSSLGGFERYLVDQGLSPSLELAAWLARLLVAFELFVGLMLFQRAWISRLILPLTMALLSAFSLYLAYLAFFRGDTGNCHCLGELVSMSPLESLVKNVILLILCGVALPRVRYWPWGRWRLPAALAAVAFGVGFMVAPIRPLPAAGTAVDPSAPSRFASFSHFSEGQVVDLTKGEVLVAFVSLDCEHCQEVTRELVEADHQAPLPSIYLVCLGSEELLQQFRFMTEAMYPALITDAETFFDFIGQSPPRLYLLRDGNPVAQWDEADFSVETLRKAVTSGE